jgi:hypothetical protein
MKKEVWMWIGGIIGVIALSFIIMIWGFGIEMFGLSLQKPLENKKTEVIRQTNQYVTTQQQMLMQYAKEYRAAEADGSTAQMSMIANQMQSVAVTLDPADIPSSVAAILAQEGL